MPEKLRVAIIGCGNIAGGYDERLEGPQVLTHAKAFQGRPEVERAVAVDPDLRRAKEFQARWGFTEAGSDLAAALEKARPQIVSICSPNATHPAVLKEALRHSPRAILCEKPLALGFADSQAMVDACRAQGCILAVNYLRRWDESITALGRRVRAGEFGRLQSARVLFTKGVFHNASHGLNLLQAWAGSVRRVMVWGARETLADGDVRASFRAELESCPDVVFQAHDAGLYNFFEMDLCFSEARIVLPWHGRGIQIARPRRSPIVPGESSLAPVEEELPWTLGTAMRGVVTNLIETVQGRAELAMPPEEALETIRACEMVRKEVQV